MRKGYKEMTYTKRIELETLLKAGYSVIEAARMLKVCEKTVYNELHRGKYTHTKSDLTTQTRYSAQIAQEKRDYNVSARGTIPKVLKIRSLQRQSRKRLLIRATAQKQQLKQWSAVGKWINMKNPYASRRCTTALTKDSLRRLPTKTFL